MRLEKENRTQFISLNEVRDEADRLKDVEVQVLAANRVLHEEKDQLQH